VRKRSQPQQKKRWSWNLLSKVVGAPLRGCPFPFVRQRERAYGSQCIDVPKPSSTNAQTAWRVFCAIELSRAVQDAIRHQVNSLKATLPDARASWSRPENTHLTLKFFGNVEQSQIPTISSAAMRTVKEVHPFKIGIGGTGVFPGVNRARVLWIGVSDHSHQLSELQRCFEEECLKEGFPKEDRRFRPHLTIARLRSPDGSRALAEAHLNTKLEEIIVEVKELIVFRSELSNVGSKYTALSRHQLK
jgi:RNA 2',3'-cyclic 3'-phosphodiesterase